ncbi:MAG: thiopurine S-methyltransferase, partial [Pseudomonadota bacterium]|nr:thiopurine S-methyltransferase [Pseudomonadota bacterium]
PPFNVSDDEVRELYGEDYDIEYILTNTLAKDHPFTKRKGLAGATESVFRLIKR